MRGKKVISCIIICIGATGEDFCKREGSDLLYNHLYLWSTREDFLERKKRNYRVSQNKLSFTELSICRFATNIISISYQLAAGFPNAQFDKTQFFCDTL